MFALETFEAGAVFPGDVGAGPGFTLDGAQEQQAGRNVLRGAQAEVEEEIENAALGVKKWAGVRSEGGTGDGQGLFEAGDVGGQQGGRRRGERFAGGLESGYFRDSLGFFFAKILSKRPMFSSGDGRQPRLGSPRTALLEPEPLELGHGGLG